MRSVSVTLGGHDLDLGLSFAAAKDVEAKVCDPMAIMREAQLEAMMGNLGQIYQPKWVFTVSNIPIIIHIGMRAAGSKATLADVQEMVAEAGFIEAKDVAVVYLAAMVTPKSQEAKKETAKDATPGE
jgi:hypothetical protein